MLYLDANVFIYPALYADRKADGAARLLRSIAGGDETAVTACLTIDEVVWAFLPELGRADASRQGRRLLDLPNLRVLDVKALDVHAALLLMERYERLSPRDAIHAAVAIGAGVFAVVSDDADFDQVQELTRRPLA